MNKIDMALQSLIADLTLNHEYCPKETILDAAAELRRLHEENETLKKCLFQMQNAAIELAKPEQEPVAWAAKSIYGGFEGLSFDKQPRFDTPLYALIGETK